jgi:hypothetical protein
MITRRNFRMILTIYTQLLIIAVLTGSCFEAYSQQKPDSLKLRQARQQHTFYRKALQVDSAKAQRVSQIQDSYKAGMNRLMADTGLNEAGRRAKVKVLMDAKNQQLRLILSPAQQAKIIPTTEREQASPPKSH